MLTLEDIHAGYGRVEVLHGVDLVVPDGSAVALLGFVATVLRSGP